jgi:hypothetical protein
MLQGGDFTRGNVWPPLPAQLQAVR